jgi:glycosyltransferase involved in cell wall biosynthesis
MISYTERGKTECIAAGIEPSRIFVSNNTLDTARLIELAESVGPEEISRLRDRLGIDGNRVVVFLGRLVPEKRVHLLVDAIRQIEPTARPELLVIGDGPERTRLSELAIDLPVHFIGAEYDEATVARYLALASVQVIPGRVGLAPVHGFASGLPCITTSDSIVAQSPEFDYIEDGVNGLILTRGDAPEFSAAIRAVLEDDDLLCRLQSGARASAAALGMDRMVDAFVGAVRLAYESRLLT